MKKLVFLFLFAFFLNSSSNAQEVKWYSWNEAYKIAQNEKKPMLVFVQANWCHWCKRMLDKTFNKEEISSIINKDFIAVKFDVDEKAEYEFKGKKYKGKELLGVLTNNELKGIPSTIFVSTVDDKTKLKAGFVDVENMKTALIKHKGEL